MESLNLELKIYIIFKSWAEKLRYSIVANKIFLKLVFVVPPKNGVLMDTPIVEKQKAHFYY
jgi:hypothetical protein